MLDYEYLERRLGEVESRINKGRRRSAYALAESNAWAFPGSARAWFQLALIAGLCGNDEKRMDAWSRARLCDDYTLPMEGDFYRDEAIALLKQGRIGEAQAAHDAAMECHRGDEDRLAALIMVQGRIELCRGWYTLALHYHKMADDRWEKLGDATTHPQWRINNLLHWLIAAVMSGRRQQAEQVFKMLIREDQNPKRKIAARLVLNGGKPACRLLFLLNF